MQKSELNNRIIYGVLAGVVALVAILAGGIAYDIFIIILAIIASMEFDRLRGDGKICFIFCAIPILLFHNPILALVLVIAAVTLVLIAEYTSKNKYPWLVISIIYISVPTIALLWLRALPNGLEMVLWLIMVIIATDVGAFIFGRKFGKNYLAPRISPKKTWEGLGGGLLCAGVISFIYTGSLTLALGAIVIAVFGQVSDLCESAIKRNFGVKDSGNILPGHGGIMDRTDGLVLTAPLVALSCYYGIILW